MSRQSNDPIALASCLQAGARSIRGWARRLWQRSSPLRQRLLDYWQILISPSQTLSLGFLSIGGFLAGIAFRGAFNTALGDQIFCPTSGGRWQRYHLVGVHLMPSRSQIARLAARIEALASTTAKQLVVVDPSETPEQALSRQGLSREEVAYFGHAGVPRSKDWGKGWRLGAN